MGSRDWINGRTMWLFAANVGLRPTSWACGLARQRTPKPDCDQRLATEIGPGHKRAMADKRKKTISKTSAPKLVTRPAPTDQDIAARAHERFLARGGEHGHDLEDWLAAEAELRG